MRKSVLGAAAVASVFTLALAACGSDNSSSSSGGATTTAAASGSATTAAAAATTAAGAATTAAGSGGRQGRRDPARHQVVGALGDGRPPVPRPPRSRRPVFSSTSRTPRATRPRWPTIADQMITSGVKVLMIVNLDSESGRGHREEGRRSGRQDHRLRPADPRRRRRRLRVVRQREGRRAAGRGPGQVPHRQGRRRSRASSSSTARRPTTTPRCSRRATTRCWSRSTPRADYVKVDDQSVPDWDNQKGGQIFEQMLTAPAARSTACSPPTTASATRPSQC